MKPGAFENPTVKGVLDYLKTHHDPEVGEAATILEGLVGSAGRVRVIRMQSKGSGAHYAGSIKALGRSRAMLLKIAQDWKAVDAQHAFTIRGIGQAFREKRKLEDNQRYEAAQRKGVVYTAKRLPTDHSLGGRISELIGLGLMEMLPTEAKNADAKEMRWVTKPEPRYHLTKRGASAPCDPDWNPQDAGGMEMLEA